MNSTAHTPPKYPMRFVTEQTGLTAATIRAWERRYGAIEPDRSSGSHRLFSAHDVQRLRWLARATELGHSIGQIARLDDDQLARLLETSSRNPEHSGDSIQSALSAIRQLDASALMEILQLSQLELGARAFVQDFLHPLMEEVGEEWHSGELSIGHEHLATATVRSFLGSLTTQPRLGESAPTIIVATPSGQRHEIGALLAAFTAALQGWRVLYLGSDLPAEALAAAAAESGADAVALSVTTAESQPDPAVEVAKLRLLLRSETRLLVGGRVSEDLQLAADAHAIARVPDLNSFEARLESMSASTRN